MCLVYPGDMIGLALVLLRAEDTFRLEDPLYQMREANNPLAQLGMSWIPPAAAADVLRLFLLQRYGGVAALDFAILCNG